MSTICGSSSSSSSSSSHDCLLCCAFNVFLQQHKCYHRLASNCSSMTNCSHPVAGDVKQPTPLPTIAPKWFINKDISREQIANMLGNQPAGAFVVRPSKTCGVGSFVLSVRVPAFINGNGIAHYLIMKTPNNRYKFQGLNDKEWSDIESLVVHHTIMREFLPCTLRMPQDASTDSQMPRVYSSSTLGSSSSSSSSSSLSASVPSLHLSRPSTTLRRHANDHEVLSDFLQSFRSRSSSARLNSPSRDVHSLQRPTVCY